MILQDHLEFRKKYKKLTEIFVYLADPLSSKKPDLAAEQINLQLLRKNLVAFSFVLKLIFV